MCKSRDDVADGQRPWRARRWNGGYAEDDGHAVTTSIDIHCTFCNFYDAIALDTMDFGAKVKNKVGFGRAMAMARTGRWLGGRGGRREDVGGQTLTRPPWTSTTFSAPSTPARSTRSTKRTSSPSTMTRSRYLNNSRHQSICYSNPKTSVPTSTIVWSNLCSQAETTLGL